MQDDGTLRCVAHWHEDGLDFEAFERASRELVLEPGENLVGLVWQSGRPMWLSDAIASGHFVREKVAADADLHGGLAFPVGTGDGCVGVIELFSREIRERDAGVYALTEGLGLQVHDFVEALRLAEEREEARLQLEAILQRRGRRRDRAGPRRPPAVRQRRRASSCSASTRPRR